MILCRDFDRPQWVRIAEVPLHYRNTGYILSLMSAMRSQWGSTFHQDGGVEDGALEYGDVNVHLGEDPAKEVECIL